MGSAQAFSQPQAQPQGQRWNLMVVVVLVWWVIVEVAVSEVLSFRVMCVYSFPLVVGSIPAYSW